MKLRPDGKPMSLSHVVETCAVGFRDYLIGVMGKELAYKYSPLITSYFYTILFFNWMGLIPGMLAPTSNPNIPISLAIVGFFCVHFIAIREAGFKSWFMHLVGEPLWLAPLNFPLHVLGEFIKPLSLSIRLLCNIFGEEMVILQLSLLAVGAIALLHVPIPLQFPMLCLSLFFGALQALVFATLLAIYIAILAVSHDDHDEHNIHGHIEHVRVHGHDEIVAHPSETSIA
jgi:F-type H+-transporting ATPase subunit a